MSNKQPTRCEISLTGLIQWDLSVEIIQVTVTGIPHVDTVNRGSVVALLRSTADLIENPTIHKVMPS